MKHKSGKLNQGANAFLRRHQLLFQLDACISGFEHIKGLYATGEDFWKLFVACLKHSEEWYS